MTIKNVHALTRAAVRALRIDVPVLNMVQGADGTLTLHLYGGQTRTWTPPASTEEANQDLTSVWGVGRATAYLLGERLGIRTPAQLAACYHDRRAELETTLSATTMKRVGEWLESQA